MILYDFGCRSGHRFEAAVASMMADDPPCPACGEATHRVPSAINMGAVADAGPDRRAMPHSWRGISGGHPDAVAHWRKTIERREKLEEKHPELAGDRRPVLAHEGIFHGNPLRAGDDVGEAVAAARKAADTPPGPTSPAPTQPQG